jgi:SAM-dependent methyltransferase
VHRDHTIDEGRPFDWGRTSADYATYRPGPPDSLFERLAWFGVGLPGQRVLDLGTGTGVMARGLARRGARATGIDIAANQIAEARRLAAEQGLDIAFDVAPAETTPFAPASFDAATANQCWLYFDKPRVLAELGRVLVPGGLIATSHFSWLADDPIAAAMEALVLRFNPTWSSAHSDGQVPTVPAWAKGLPFVGMVAYDVDVPFTRESWRGRVRACRGVGASLSDDLVAAFDREHAALLERSAPERFTVRHRVDAHVVRLP